jgi:protein-tyrosine-phosphatase
MAAARFSILFLCKWNAGRSIFAEYLMRQLASQRFEAFSAGVTPVGHVSRVTLKVLKDHYQVDASDARSKSWHEFQDHQLDFIVCLSEEAEETSHAFPGKPILANWPFRDPRKTKGSAKHIEDSYFRVAASIRHRLQLFKLIISPLTSWTGYD